MRWEIELGFRDVKTSMGAEFLRYRTPEMVVKGARFFFLANNVMQLLAREMLGSAVEFRLSFKGGLPAEPAEWRGCGDVGGRTCTRPGMSPLPAQKAPLAAPRHQTATEKLRGIEQTTP